MFAADFDYYRADTPADAVRLLGEHPGARLLAGGQSLLPLMKLRLSSPPALVDIGRIAALRGFRTEDATLRVRALTTHAVLASSPSLGDACPLLAEAAAGIGDPQVRNRGTIGGNLAHADPASDLPTVLTALDATCRITGPSGEREVPISGFFQGALATTVAENEILTDVVMQARQRGQGMAYAKFTHPASRYAVLGAAVVVTMQDGRCQEARVAVGGLVPSPVRATSVEKALSGQQLTPQAISDAADQVAQDLGDEILEDLFASAEYRRAMAPLYVRDALTRASDAAQR